MTKIKLLHLILFFCKTHNELLYSLLLFIKLDTTMFNSKRKGKTINYKSTHEKNSNENWLTSETALLF